MDPDSARSTLGIRPEAALTTNTIEAAYEQARERAAVFAGQSGAALDGGGLRRGQLDEARVVLMKRAVRVPPHGEAMGTLTVIQFFVGGFVLFVAAIGLMVGWATWYDGALSLIGWTVGAVWIALTSMIVSLLVGLPLRLAPKLRRRWLANGELTFGGAVLGFLATEIVIATAPVSTVVDDLGPYESRDVNGWALFIAWSLFAFSIAHFVWPLRWTQCRKR
ncbi:MAG TPA: hypothetical protein VF156_07080 [Agromyces sp.]